MRLLPGYATAAVSVRAEAVHRQLVSVANLRIVDAVAFEILPPFSPPAQSADLAHARTGIQQYSRIDKINQRPMGSLDIYA